MIAAYFSPTWAMLRRISRVARHGRARIVTAAKSDNAATISAARHTYRRLLRRGVELYEYAPTKLHSKLVIIDGRVAQISVSSGRFHFSLPSAVSCSQAWIADS